MALIKKDLLARASDLALAAATERARNKRQTAKKTKPKKPAPAKLRHRAARYPQIGRLDGKPRRRRSGRHAVKRGDNDGSPDPPREAAPLTAQQRLGFRIPEWCALLGISKPTGYRAINAGKVEIVEINGIKYVPRAFAIRVGLITVGDNIHI